MGEQEMASREVGPIDQARAATAVAGCLSGDTQMVTEALNEAAEDDNALSVWNLVACLASDLGFAIVEQQGDDALALVQRTIVDYRELAELRGEA